MVYAGGMSVLKPYIDSGKFVIRSKQVAFDKVATRNWDGATAQSRMDNLLSAFYGKDHLDAVWTPNDAIAIGVISSLKGVGYGSAAASDAGGHGTGRGHPERQEHHSRRPDFDRVQGHAQARRA